MSDSSGMALTRVLAVVDSRNILNQIENITGFRRRPTVQGVIDALADFGLDATEVHVGVAVAENQMTKRLFADQDDRNRKYIQKIEAHPRGRVLLGELRRGRSETQPEEKIVDVACAVDVASTAAAIRYDGAPFEAIVVLSEDIDMTPAYAAAMQLGVPLFVASAKTVHQRKDPHLLLSERALAKIGGVGDMHGHQLRTRVGQVASGGKAIDWTVECYSYRRNGFSLVGPDGTPGVYPTKNRSEMSVGSTVSLFPAGVDFGDGQLFPVVKCSSVEVESTLTRMRVLRRPSPLDAAISTGQGQHRKLSYPIGHLTPDTKVWVAEDDDNKMRIVGCVDSPKQIRLSDGTALDTCQGTVVTITDVIDGSPPQGSDTHGNAVELLTPFLNKKTRPQIGQRVVAVPHARSSRTGVEYMACAISSTLP